MRVEQTPHNPRPRVDRLMQVEGGWADTVPDQFMTDRLRRFFDGKRAQLNDPLEYLAPNILGVIQAAAWEQQLSEDDISGSYNSPVGAMRNAVYLFLTEGPARDIGTRSTVIIPAFIFQPAMVSAMDLPWTDIINDSRMSVVKQAGSSFPFGSMAAYTVFEIARQLGRGPTLEPSDDWIDERWAEVSSNVSLYKMLMRDLRLIDHRPYEASRFRPIAEKLRDHVVRLQENSAPARHILRAVVALDAVEAKEFCLTPTGLRVVRERSEKGSIAQAETLPPRASV